MSDSLPPSGSTPPPDPEGAAPSVPGEPILPAPPQASSGAGLDAEEAPERRRWLVGIGVGALILVVLGVIAIANPHRDDAFPTDIGRLHRLHTSQVQQLEDQTSSFKFGDVNIGVAGYGSGESVELVLFRYSDLPAQPPISSILRGAGGGIVGTGGSVDFDAETSRLRDGIQYSCLPFTGRLFPDDISDTGGQVCAWTEGGDVMLIMDAQAPDAASAVGDASTAHAALG